jgi:phage terminase large subunit-like protein
MTDCGGEFWFDEKAAARVLRFFRQHVRHVDGRGFAGKPFIPEPWQERILRDVFGWKRTADDTRRFRTVYLEVPRKNGKTTLAAGLALYLLLCDGEDRPQVYSAAGDRAQARICFESATGMVQKDKRLTDQAKCWKHRITGESLGGFYTAVSSEAYSKHGFNASGIIFDELHVQPDRDLWDVLTTSTGARKQPLTIAITTAGHDRSTICWELHNRSLRSMERPDEDPAFYGVVYGAAPEDDWTDEAIWRKANPNLGVSISLDYLREACDAAQRSPDAENTFRNLHLNQWTEQAVRWLPMHAWDKCAEAFTAEDMEGQTCFGGLDLASTRDTNSFSLVFPQDDETFRVLNWYWAPEDSVTARAEQDRREVLNWGRKKLLTLTEGNVAHFGRIARDIVELCNRFDVRKIAFDGAGPAAALVQQLEELGIDNERLVRFPQTIMQFSGPSKHLETLVCSHRIHHNGDPVLRWMVGNVSIKRDANDNIRPDKDKSSDKIDGVVALIQGLALAFDGAESEWNFQPGSLAL